MDLKMVKAIVEDGGNVWICDHCGEFIQKPTDGWVQWKNDTADTQSWDLSLVHHFSASPLVGKSRCYFEEKPGSKEHVRNMHLEHFLGPDGLLRLIRFTEGTRFPLDEVLELIRRLNVPGYDVARQYQSEAIAAGFHEPDRPDWLLAQDQIRAIIKFAIDLRDD